MDSPQINVGVGSHQHSSRSIDSTVGNTEAGQVEVVDLTHSDDENVTIHTGKTESDTCTRFAAPLEDSNLQVGRRLDLSLFAGHVPPGAIGREIHIFERFVFSSERKTGQGTAPTMRHRITDDAITPSRHTSDLRQEGRNGYKEQHAIVSPGLSTVPLARDRSTPRRYHPTYPYSTRPHGGLRLARGEHGDGMDLTFSPSPSALHSTCHDPPRLKYTSYPEVTFLGARQLQLRSPSSRPHGIGVNFKTPPIRTIQKSKWSLAEERTLVKNALENTTLSYTADLIGRKPGACSNWFARARRARRISGFGPNLKVHDRELAEGLREEAWTPWVTTQDASDLSDSRIRRRPGDTHRKAGDAARLSSGIGDRGNAYREQSMGSGEAGNDHIPEVHHQEKVSASADGSGEVDEMYGDCRYDYLDEVEMDEDLIPTEENQRDDDEEDDELL